jgi:hypothetical protein
MKHKLTILSLLLISFDSIGQINSSAQPPLTSILAREYSKEMTLYLAKYFVAQEVLTSEENAKQFSLESLTASTSGELTALSYLCKSENKSGLILGFYGNEITDYGNIIKTYAFKEISKEKAQKMFDLINKAIEENKDFLIGNTDENNLLLKYEDMEFVIYFSAASYKIRLLWNGFDAEWDFNSMKRTQKRLAKNI